MFKQQFRNSRIIRLPGSESSFRSGDADLEAVGEFSGVPVGENDLLLSGLFITDGVRLLIEVISDLTVTFLLILLTSVMEPYLEGYKLKLDPP